MEDKVINKEKGITLIVLVITIIVLLILAGVTIGTILGDKSIINSARQAEEKVNNLAESTAQEIEEIESLLTGKGNTENGNPSGLLKISATIDNFKEEYNVGDTINFTITVSNDLNVEIENVVVDAILSGATGSVIYTNDDVSEGIIVNFNQVQISSIKSGENKTIQCEYKVVRGDAGANIKLVATANADPIIYNTSEIYNIEEASTETSGVNVEQIYNLTIHYVYADGTIAAPNVTCQYLAGEIFIHYSPEIAGYTPNFPFMRSDVQGMPAQNVEVTVVYTAN